MKRVAIMGSLLSLALTLAIPSFGQAPQPSYKGGPAEYAKYSPIFTEKDPAKKAVLIEDFLKAYPDSDFAPTVYQLLSVSYSESQQNAKVIEVADRFDASSAVKSQFVTDKNKIVIYSNAANAAFATSNMDKMNAYIDKDLAVDHDMSNGATVNMLLNIGQQLGENLPKDDAGKKAVIDRTFEIISKADTAVKNFKGLPPDQLPGINATIQATYGLVALTRLNYDEAVRRYEEATKLNPKNDISWYRLGLAYQGQGVAFSKKLEASLKQVNDAKSAKADQVTIGDLTAIFDALTDQVKAKQAAAMDALAKAVALAGPAAAPARTALENLWKPTHNNSTDGLEDFINSKKG